MTASVTCPKCGKTMTEGFVLDQSHGARLASKWYAGAPQKSFFLGITLSGLENHVIQSYRCPSCGFLESYAGRR